MPSLNPFLWVALDDIPWPPPPTTTRLLQAMNEVPGAWGWKINLDAFVHLGASGAVAGLPDNGKSTAPRPRFADIKGHNGRRTLTRLLKPLAVAEFTHVNFHVGESDDLGSVAERARELGLRTMGMTQLSHGGISVGRIQQLAQTAEEFGLDEVIMPAAIAAYVTTTLQILGTGLRPQGPDQYQPHALHPSDARGRVDSVAIGAPIMRAKDPTAALQQHLEWLHQETDRP